MGQENSFIKMEDTMMGSGAGIKWVVMGNYIISQETLPIKDIGVMTDSMVGVNFQMINHNY